MFCGATVINVDYGRFPEHQLPSQMHDVAKVYLHLLNEGINNSDIVIIGDSAGATLAMTSSLWIRDNGYPMPNHIVCFSLWADATSSGDSRITNAYTDPFYGIAKHKRLKIIFTCSEEYRSMFLMLTELTRIFRHCSAALKISRKLH